MSTETATKPVSKKKTETVVIPGEGTIDFNYDEGHTSLVEEPHYGPAVRKSSKKDDAILTVVVGTVIAGAVGILSYFGWKAEKERQAKLEEQHQATMEALRAERDEREEWVNRVRVEGKIIVETVDGEYMAIPAEAYAKSEIRKKV